MASDGGITGRASRRLHLGGNLSGRKATAGNQEREACTNATEHGSGEKLDAVTVCDAVAEVERQVTDSRFQAASRRHTDAGIASSQWAVL
jgi:hypothetical protein